MTDIKPMLIKFPWFTLYGQPDKPGRLARIRCAAAMLVHEAVELVAGTPTAHSMGSAMRYSIGAPTITVPASQRNKLFFTTIEDGYPDVGGDLIGGRGGVELRVYSSGAVNTSFESIYNPGSLVEVRLSNPLTGQWETFGDTPGLQVVSGDVTISTLETSLVNNGYPTGSKFLIGHLSVVYSSNANLASYPGGIVTGGSVGIYEFDGTILTFQRLAVANEQLFASNVIDESANVLGSLGSPVNTIIQFGPDLILYSASLDSSVVAFDNTVSDLPAATLQDAIDALAAEETPNNFFVFMAMTDEQVVEMGGIVTPGVGLEFNEAPAAGTRILVSYHMAMTAPYYETFISDGSTILPVEDPPLASFAKDTENLGGQNASISVYQDHMPMLHGVPEPVKLNTSYMLIGDQLELDYGYSLARGIHTVDQIVACDAAGTFEPFAPLPTPAGYRVAIMGQTTEMWNGIWMGQTPDPEDVETYLPMLKIADLPESGMITSDSMSYDLSHLGTGGISGGWIVSTIASGSTDPEFTGLGVIGLLPWQGWSLVYSTSIMAGAIIDATEQVRTTIQPWNITTDQTLPLEVAGSIVTMDAATPTTLTVPVAPDVDYPLGTIIQFQNIGSADLTVEPDTGGSFSSTLVVPPDTSAEIWMLDYDYWIVRQSAAATVDTWTRTSTSTSTASLANNATETRDLPTSNSGRAYRIFGVETSVPARVRVYVSSAARAADASRAIGIDPTGPHGLILELVTTTGDLVWPITPAVDGYTDDLGPYYAYVSVTNLSGATASVTYAITWIRTE